LIYKGNVAVMGDNAIVLSMEQMKEKKTLSSLDVFG
jgi:hypothetical protein